MKEGLLPCRLSVLVHQDRIAETQFLQLVELRLLVAGNHEDELLRMKVLLRKCLVVSERQLLHKRLTLLDVVERQTVHDDGRQHAAQLPERLEPSRHALEESALHETEIVC